MTSRCNWAGCGCMSALKYGINKGFALTLLSTMPMSPTRTLCRGREDGEHIQKVVHVWVEEFVGYPPSAEDVALVGGYLAHCVK